MRRPNLLWLMTDEQRCDSLGCYGSPWAVSPHLDALAAEGCRFASAYTPSPVCAAARASLLTGRRCSAIGVLNNHHTMPLEHARFLTWELARAGYQVASFGKQHYNAPRQAFDLEAGWVLGDKVHYSRYLGEVDPEAMGVVRYESAEAAFNWILAGRFPGAAEETPELRNVQAALRWLDRRDPDRPFCLRVSLNAPHTPVVAPEPWDTLVDADAVDLPVDGPGEPQGVPSPIRDHLQRCAGTHPLTLDQIRRTRQCYYGLTAFVDHCLGTLLEALRGRGELDRTIVAFVSDHGNHLGDHGFYQKQSFYEASARVPWLLAGPDLPAATVLDTPVNLASLLPTLLDLTGLAVPDGLDFPSLAEAATSGSQPPAAPVLSEIDYGIWDWRDGDRYVMVRDGDWKLGLFRDPHEPERFAADDGLMLHNLRDDPGERRNLAGSAQAATVDSLLRHLDCLAGD